VLGLSNFLTLQTFGARQNHLLRINHTRIPPLRSSRSPLIKFFPRAPNTGTNFVAQGAAPFAGNSRRICTSIFIGLKSVWNQHLQNKSRGHPDESKPAIKEWVSCSSGRAGLHYFRPARPEAFVLQKRIRRCMRKSLRIRTYTKTGEGVPPRCHRHQDIRGATKSGERDTCGQKQLPRPKFGLVMTT